MRKITPETVKHNSLKQIFDAYLEANGFRVATAAYHEVMPPEFVGDLRTIYSPSGIYYRCRADNIAIRAADGIAFEYDIKTHMNKRYTDLTIEVLPLLSHMAAHKFGAKCAYVYRVNGTDGYFWAHELPPVRVVMIPKQTRYEDVEKVRELCADYLPGVNVVNINGGYGSGDPFAIIDSEHIFSRPHWKNIIRDFATPKGQTHGF